MYLFIKDSLVNTKLYIDSNAQNFFKSLERQLETSKLFYKAFLKEILFEFIKKIFMSFEFLKLKLINDKIASRFKKEDFTEAKKEINEKLKKTQEENKGIIESKYDLIVEQYDQLIKDYKDGNLKSYDKSFKETNKKNNEIFLDMQKEIDGKIHNFRIELIATFKKYIGNKIEEIRKELLSINKQDSVDLDVNKDVDKMEKDFYEGIGEFVEDIGKAIIESIPNNLINRDCSNQLIEEGLEYIGTYYGFQGLGFANLQTLSLLGTQGLNFLGSTVLPVIGIGALSCLTFAGLFHGGLYLYKKFTQKSKYIELIEDLKKKLKDIFIIIEEDHNKVLKYYSK
jgi:soluble cytochrome b562